MKTRYTKDELEKIVFAQYENLNAMNDLLRIMKLQNELIENSNKRLKDEISEFKKVLFRHHTVLNDNEDTSGS